MAEYKIDNNAISNIIMEDIVNDIILGKLKPGDKLIEAKYAEKFGVSRAPIREAFNTLTIEGIVVKVPRKETVVKGYTNEEIWDLVRIRKFLEDLAFEKVVTNTRLTNLVHDLKNIESKMDMFNTKDYAKLNQEFHLRIISESESDVLIAMYTRMARLLLSLQLVAIMETKNLSNSHEEHKNIILMLEQGNILEAQKVLNQHNEAFLQNIKNHLLKKENEIFQQN
ncbi:GntR family transcriptional regulator [Bacillus sp. EB600]|uniref:GntR family transcriptional regulator n=1 Tax=Bacillus sp. EB600 TaxID=2806345 RepID=UPI00210D66C3|nr:GntR family transcriptional regulator [Bacillus sp. EB600]MCQ6279567.1 GntR family transcriptional regulator [Bacillus sp. EB600]